MGRSLGRILEGLVKRLRPLAGPRERPAQYDDAYERKLELMEQRLGELGSAADVLQRSQSAEGDWHPEPRQGPQEGAQA
jgi:hypothetical protein